MKAIEQHSPVVLFIMLYKVVLTFESVDEILKCDHSNESCVAVRAGGTESAIKLWEAVLNLTLYVFGILKYNHFTESFQRVLPVTLFNLKFVMCILSVWD